MYKGGGNEYSLCRLDLTLSQGKQQRQQTIRERLMVNYTVVPEPQSVAALNPEPL